MRRTTKQCNGCGEFFRVGVIQTECSVCGGPLKRRNPSDKAVFWENEVIGAVRRAKKYLNINPSTETVASMLGCNFNTAEQHLVELEAQGVVSQIDGKWRILKHGNDNYKE